MVGQELEVEAGPVTEFTGLSIKRGAPCSKVIKNLKRATVEHTTRYVRPWVTA